jgi:Calcineurin-like phosphoesterase
MALSQGFNMNNVPSPASGVRLLILSDLHLEFSPFPTPDPTLYDVVVLAGDIAAGSRAVLWARNVSDFVGKPVVLVPGNHEYYGGERARTLELMRAGALGSGVHVLDRDEVVLHGIRFVGATLWTDFQFDAPLGRTLDEAMTEASRGLNDFAGAIRQRVQHPPRERRFTPLDALREHRASRAWLQERLDAPIDADVVSTVVVTHHCPSGRSMDPQYAGSRLNPCFYSELPASFFQTAELWVHGHSHSSADYVHHATRVLANPRGYVRRWDRAVENSAFQEDLVVTVGARP